MTNNISANIHETITGVGDNFKPHTNIEAVKLPTWLTQFVDTYQQLSTTNLSLLETIYTTDVKFKDPMHELDGLDNLTDYFESLYTNLSRCEFEIHHYVHTQEEASLYWVMTYEHPKLNGGEPIYVDGHTHIKGREVTPSGTKAGESKACESKVYYHCDYVDLGAMLYENIPLVGKVIKWIKFRASQ